MIREKFQMPEITDINDDMHVEPQSADRLLHPYNLHPDLRGGFEPGDALPSAEDPE